MRVFRAAMALFEVSFRRLLWSTSTLMVGIPILLGVIFLLQRRYIQSTNPAAVVVEFSDFLLFFVSFFVPICALAYGTATVGGDREDRTLLFLLVRPTPRWVILLAKYAATLPLVLGIVMGSLYLLCRMAGAAGGVAFAIYETPVFYAALAYTSLFTLFAVSFRHATILSLVYALFIELVLGNMPGIVKQIAINYYARSMIFAAGAIEGLNPPDARWFVPVTWPAGAAILLGISGVSLGLAMLVFSTREYRDLS